MAEPRLLERLTASDLFMLLWDDYGWSTDIGALAILDGTSLLDPDGHLRIEAVHQRLEPRLHLVPRFRQLLFRPGRGWAGRRLVASVSHDGRGAQLATLPPAASGSRLPGGQV